MLFYKTATEKNELVARLATPVKPMALARSFASRLSDWAVPGRECCLTPGSDFTASLSECLIRESKAEIMVSKVNQS